MRTGRHTSRKNSPLLVDNDVRYWVQERIPRIGYITARTPGRRCIEFSLKGVLDSIYDNTWTCAWVLTTSLSMHAHRVNNKGTNTKLPKTFDNIVYVWEALLDVLSEGYPHLWNWSPFARPIYDLLSTKLFQCHIGAVLDFLSICSGNYDMC